MMKFTLIITLIFSNGFLAKELENTELPPSIEFSKPALEFESGQPVFPVGTEAYLRNLPSSESRVVINDKVDKILTNSRVEVSKLVKLSEGTYTVLVELQDGKNETFGFTIK